MLPCRGTGGQLENVLNSVFEKMGHTRFLKKTLDFIDLKMQISFCTLFIFY